MSSSATFSRCLRRLTVVSPASVVAATETPSAGDARVEGDCMFICPTRDSAPIKLEFLRVWSSARKFFVALSEICGGGGGGIMLGIAATRWELISMRDEFRDSWLSWYIDS